MDNARKVTAPVSIAKYRVKDSGVASPIQTTVRSARMLLRSQNLCPREIIVSMLGLVEHGELHTVDFWLPECRVLWFAPGRSARLVPIVAMISKDVSWGSSVVIKIISQQGILVSTMHKRELGAEMPIQPRVRNRPRMVEIIACIKAGGFSGQIQLARRTASTLLEEQSFAHERFQRGVQIVVLISKVASLVDQRPLLVTAGRIS